jgi:hypothetical protein
MKYRVLIDQDEDGFFVVEPMSGATGRCRSLTRPSDGLAADRRASGSESETSKCWLPRQ